MFVITKDRDKYCDFSCGAFVDATTRKLGVNAITVLGIETLTDRFSGDRHIDFVLWTEEPLMVDVRAGATSAILYFFKKTQGNQSTFFRIAHSFVQKGRKQNQRKGDRVEMPAYGFLVVFNTMVKTFPVCDLETAVDGAIQFVRLAQSSN